MSVTAEKRVELDGAARVAWSSLRSGFERNLAAFDARTGLGEAVQAAWRAAAGQLQLLRFDDGDAQVYSRLPDCRGWLPAGGGEPDVRPARAGPVEMIGLRRGWEGRVIRTLAVNGIGLGFVPLALIAASRATFLDFSPRVLLIEPSLLGWAVALHLHDWQAALAEPRVRVCAGPQALALLDVELADVERSTPLLLSGGAWAGDPDAAAVQARLSDAEAARKQRQQALHAGVTAALAGRDRAAWAERFTAAVAAPQTSPLTILGITSRYTSVLQYTMRDLLSAFAALGHTAHLVIEPDANAHFSPIATLETIARTRPDLIVLIDHTQREFSGTLPDGIPVVAWIQDQLPHLFRAEAGAGIRPLEFVFGHGFPECLTRFGYPPERFLPCRIPTNPASLLDPGETAADLAPFRCDVMFAANATVTPRQIFERCRARATADARPLLDAACEALGGLLRTEWFCGDYDYARLLAQCERATGREITHAGMRAETVNMLRGVADQALRERVAGWAAEWAETTGGRLHLYGRGWETRPAFARFARGFVPHGPLLGRAFRGAKISLHAGVNPALHQRVIDGLCAGGFFLIAEKPFDTSHTVSHAILEYYRRVRPEVPFRVTPELLPEPAAAACRRGMWLRGVDPAGGDLNGPDEVLNLEMYCAHRLMHSASGIWPRYGEIVFHGRDAFFARLDRFTRDAALRCELAAGMRAAVIERFAYDALARRLLQFVRDGLAGRTTSLLSEPQAPARGDSP